MEKEKNGQLKIGIILILTSATMTCVGQFFWKMGAEQPKYFILFYLAGFALYGIGALLMLVAFKFGEMSVLHPMLSIGFVGSLILGSVFLKEEIHVKKVCGILFILIGIIFLSRKPIEQREDGEG